MENHTFGNPNINHIDYSKNRMILYFQPAQITIFIQKKSQKHKNNSRNTIINSFTFILFSNPCNTAGDW